MSLVANGNGRGLPAVMQPEQIDYGRPDQPIIRYTLTDVEVMAKKVAQAGMFGMNEAQAFALMMLCDADGLHPMLAVRRYHILKFGTPSMRAETMLAEMQARGWSVRWTTKNNDRQRQEAFFQHPKKCPEGQPVEYSEKDAEIAELLSGPNAANWRKHRPNMLRARVISNACRMLEPAIVAGVYTPDEAAEIEAERTPAPTLPARTKSELHAALDDARRRPSAPAEPPAPRTEFGAWLDTRIADAFAKWGEIARGAGLDPGRPMRREQVANHLVKSWIELGTLEEGDVQAGGKRDKAKVAAVVTRAWERDPDDLCGEIDEYLTADIDDRCLKAGIPIPDDDDAPADADERQGMADEDPADPEGFALGK